MNITLGMKAPDFTSMTTFGQINLSDYNGHWVILFSHPGDFTPVCTTEFVAFAQANDQFEALNAKLIGLSIDSNTSHLAWVNQIYQLTGIQIPFPVIADRMADIANLYGMISPSVNKQETVRNVFFIDPAQIVRAILVYPLTNGRNIYEILRLLTAIQTTDKCNVITPANWEPGNPVMVPPPGTYNQLQERANPPGEPGLNCMDWFWCYKEDICK
ncbi:peroxiredoxin [Anaerocolumna xylanovorans]|uniref:Peroxiredoxin n=1 Tax=Anaerocolumna xylanovorans DSM 12503 TaxID=1121345 RepID=A0A1M7YN35_9FIRM|nr:peroxiredoxin [Anaerocolumna xylanovorans]SHO54015.1 3-Cys thioredoxin peroxidase [Anaerocolumna xylanovorans DSM 12503]